MRTFSICAVALMGCSLTSKLNLGVDVDVVGGVATVVMKPGAAAPSHLFGIALKP
jgi:hypothetical protein